MGQFNEVQYLLTCLGEECNEIAQRVSKSLRFGLSEVQPGHEGTNLARLELEIVDFLATLDTLQKMKRMDVMCVDTDEMPRCYSDAFREKKQKIQKFMEYSRKRGTLE